MSTYKWPKYVDKMNSNDKTQTQHSICERSEHTYLHSLQILYFLEQNVKEKFKPVFHPQADDESLNAPWHASRGQTAAAARSPIDQLFTFLPTLYIRVLRNSLLYVTNPLSTFLDAMQGLKDKHYGGRVFINIR